MYIATLFRNPQHDASFRGFNKTQNFEAVIQYPVCFLVCVRH
ncbi:hypothetical protein KCP75_00130 [Salmonella enterica subsp. enterica]|nr:hypothetical protein KCP75_00130 [Salmonella enterica subsp. enterica]